MLIVLRNDRPSWRLRSTATRAANAGTTLPFHNLQRTPVTGGFFLNARSGERLPSTACRDLSATDGMGLPR